MLDPDVRRFSALLTAKRPIPRASKASTTFSTLLFIAAMASAQSAISVEMAQYNLERTNANLHETILTPQNVNPQTFGKIFERKVNDSVYAEPLIIAGLDIGGRTRNVLIVATMSNTVFAFDADDPEAGKPLWTRKVGTPAVGNNWIGPFTFGILSTPFFDRSTNTIYLVSKNNQDKRVSNWVHALDVFTGQPKFNSPQEINFPFADGKIVMDAPDVIQRAALLVTQGVLVVATASVLPYDMQEGFVQSFDASDLRRRLASFQVTPTGLKGGIWHAGRGIPTDGEGNIFVSTAGGDYDGVRNFGSSVLKFEAKTLKLTDWFTPVNHEILFKGNTDLSAGGIILIPGTNLLIAGGKEGVVYLIDRTKMGRLETEDSKEPPVQRFQASFGCHMTECSQHLGAAYWNLGSEGMLYIWDRRDILRAFRFHDQRLETKAAAVSTMKAVVTGGPTLSANGGDRASGIVWALTASEEPDFPEIPGTLRAFAASDVSKEIYSSASNRRDSPGGFTKFATPVVANGKVYVPTQSGKIAVYGLRSSAAR